MSDYIMEAKIRLRIKDAKDEYEGQEMGESFLTLGLQSLAMSDDPDDDHFEIEGVNFLSFEEDPW